MTSLKHLVHVYVSLMAAAGLLLLSDALRHASGVRSWQFLLFIATALVGSRWKVLIPNTPGSTVSVGYVIVLLAVYELSLGETVLVALAAAVSQSLFHAKNRPQPIQVVFNCAALLIAGSLAWHTYHSSPGLAQVWSGLVALVLSGAVQFLCNTLSMAVVLALIERRSVQKIWVANYFWVFPYYLLGALLTAIGAVFSRQQGWPAVLVVLPVGYGLYSTFRLYIRRLDEERKHVQELSDVYLRAVHALALAIDAKDDCTHDHLHRVTVYASEIGQELGLADQQLRALEAAAILHDVGKIAVPDYVIAKPGKLTPAEFQKMKIHPVVGAEIVEHIHFPYAVAPIVRSHHEKWNGRGYPDGLKGEEIPIGARIISVVDCFDALSSDRQYRTALPLADALQIIASEAGASFDPRIVEILLRRAYELERKARANTGSVLKLSLNVQVERGDAPGAGFADAPLLTAATSTEALQRMPYLLEHVSAVAALGHLAHQFELADLMSMLCQRLEPAIPHHAAVLWLRTGLVLEARWATGDLKEQFRGVSIQMGAGISGWALQTNQVVVNGNPVLEGLTVQDCPLHSALVCPFLKGESSFALAFYHRDVNAFDAGLAEALVAIVPEVGNLIQGRLEAGPARRPNTGPLLLLQPSGVLDILTSHIAQCAAGKRTLAILVVEDCAAALLATSTDAASARVRFISDTIRSVVRETDFVGRLSATQMLAVLPDATASVVGPKIMAISAALNATVAVGHAIYPEHGTRLETLLAQAFNALPATRERLPDMSECLARLQASLRAAPEWPSTPAGTGGADEVSVVVSRQAR